MLQFLFQNFASNFCELWNLVNIQASDMTQMMPTFLLEQHGGHWFNSLKLEITEKKFAWCYGLNLTTFLIHRLKSQPQASLVITVDLNSTWLEKCVDRHSHKKKTIMWTKKADIGVMLLQAKDCQQTIRSMELIPPHSPQKETTLPTLVLDF